MPKRLARLGRTHAGLVWKRRPALVLVCAAVVVTYAFAAAVVTGHEAQSAAVGGGLAFVHGSDAAGIAGAGAFVWISNGDGTFTTCRTGTTGFDRDGAGTEVFGGSSASQTFVVDANGDGLADIVHVSENSGHSIWTYPAQGDGTFATTAISTTGIDNTGVGAPFAGGDQAGQQGFLGDVTGDGVADYIFTRDASNIGVFVWPGNGDGTFSTAAPIATTAFTGTVPGSILTGQDTDEHTFLMDVTADGNPDLVHVGEGGGRTIAVWAGIGDGTFETAPVTSSGFVNTGVGTGVFAGTAASEHSFMDDLTGDDVPDFVYANETGIFVWPGTGAGGFSTAAPTATTGFAEPFASFTGQSAAEEAQLVDVTGDDVFDYVMSKDDEAANAGIYVWRGLGDGTFATAAVASRASGGLMAFATGFSATETSRIAPVVDAELPAGACTPAAPGGVGAGLAVWNRADAGIAAGNGQTVQTWQNSADSTWSVAQATAGARPTYHDTTPANLLNFNPSLRFDGGDELFKTNVRLYHGSAGFHGIAVGRDQRTMLTQLRAPMGLGTNGNFPGFDLQTDASSPSGWNPYMGTGSSPNPWPGSTARLFNGNGGRTNRQPQIFGLASANGGAGTASNNLVSSVDGFEEATTLDAVNQAAIGGGLWIGSSGDANWLGLVSEAIVYSRRLSAAEVRRINSYLALKYGITLGAGGGPAQDYHDSAGATIRSEPAYHNDVAGIGRDDASALDQRQSASVNAGGLVTMGLGGIAATNAANPTAFGADRSFLVWGHNGAAASLSLPVGGTSLTRMARVWRVTETGTVGDVRLRVPTSALPGSLQGVVRSADPVFDSSDDLIPLALGPAGYETTLDFANGDYFTLAAALPSPGGVEGESLWLRGDIGMSCVANGCTVTRWDDVSGNGKHANVSAGTLSRTSAGVNFNPVLGFDDNEQATGPSLLGAGTYSDANIYVVSKKTAIGPTADFYEASTASRLGVWQPYTDGFWYWDAGHALAPHRLSAPASELTLDAFELKTYNASTTAGQTLGGSIRQGMIKNGRLVASDTDYADFTGANGSYFVGGNGVNTGAEELAELIAYLSPITAVQQQAIQSYLALKYGITLDQTAPHDYVASDGSVIWDATANATYSNRIAGIGRDDASALVQRQSRSSNPGASAGLVTIGRGTIAADNDSNPSQFDGNRNFLLWGDRGGSVSFGTAIVPPPDVLASQRMERVWRVQETGEVGQVTVGIPSSVGNNNTVYLVVSDDETFDAADTFVPLSRGAASSPGYLAAEVDLESGTHFTFATTSASPGGVEANLQLWLRADAGVTADSTVSSWADQSPSARVASQDAAASQPALEPNAINFNPALDFDGTTDWLNLSSLTGFPTGNTDRTVAAVAASTNPGGAAGTIVSYGTGATNQASIFGQYTAGPAWFGGWGNDLFVTGSPWSATPRILLGTQNDTANTATLFSNGASIGTHTSTAWNTVLAQGRVGRQISTVTQYWPGPIGEIVLYNRLVTANERLRVNSYLALKYGLTLDQTTATNYLHSGGGAVWNATTNASYANNVAGIGLDIASGLVQKQSRSVHETENGNLLTVGLGTIAADNETNPSAFAADRSFLVWGDDGGRTIFATPIAAPPEAAANFRMNRVWRVQKTGTVGSVKVAVPASLDQGRPLYLVVSDDATFDGADEFVPLEPHSAGEDYLAADVDLASGQHLTFATYQIAPGGVAGATLWLRADRSVGTEDTTVVGWRDVANGALFAQDGAQALPLYETSNPAFNFNPSLDFLSGTATRLRGVVGTLANASPDRWSIFASVVKEGNNQRFFAHRNVGSNHYHLDSAQGGRAQLQVEYRTGATVPNAPLLVGVTWDETTRRGYLDGRMTISPAGTVTTSTFTFPGEAAVGGGYGLADWTGHVAEIVAYDRDLTIAEARRVNSYLALKYGRTLDQTPATSYVASDSSMVWDATANGGFAVDIAGIGRDDLSGLDQKQSASANAGNVVTVGLGGIAPDNESNGSTFAEDKSFLVWGHDGATTEVSTAIPGTATLRRMNRLWKVDETKSVPDVLVRIPAGQLPAAALSAEPPAIVVSSDATITSDDTFVPLTLTNGNYEATIDLADGDHFTFAATVTAPGGVAPGLQLWLRADKGLTVNAASNATGWADQSQQGRNADLVFSDPQRRNAAVNFNPTVNFDGNDWFRFSKSPFVTGLTAGEMFGLTQDQAAVGCGCGHFFDFGSGSRNSHYAWNEHVYDGFGTTDRFGWHPVTKAIVDAKTGISAISGAVPAIDVRAPHIYNVGSATNSWHVAFDGQTAAATGTNTTSFTLAAGNEHIGAVTSYPYQGDVAEVMLYDRRLVANERARVNTYYALKYGVTLPALNYLDSASSVLWPTGNGYGNDIAGIGRDDASGLDQRQSASINAGNVVTVGHGAIAADNASNPNGFDSDRSFVLWGHNGATAEQTVAVSGTSPALSRMARIWRVEETGQVGTVVLRIPKSALRGRAHATLIRSTDTTFTSADRLVPLALNGSAFEATVDLADDEFFTFASLVPGPGGVTAGLHMWWRADGFSPTNAAGAVTDIDDETGNYALGWTSHGPQKITGGLNFNPYVNFEGNDWIVRNDSQSSTFTQGEKFAVGRHAQAFTGNNGVLFRFGESTAHAGGSHYLHSNGSYYNDFCSSERKAWNPSTRAVVEGGGTTTGPAVDARRWHILGMRSATNNWVHQFDAVTAYTDTASAVNCAGTLMYIGAHESYPYNGDIAEGFVYNRVLSIDERLRANTYLALKYGITLGSTAAPVEYRASNSAPIWVADAAYQNDVAGIGRDDRSALDQRQSTSINQTSVVTMGHGSIAADNQSNPNAFPGDGAYLVWGDNGQPTTASTPVPDTPTPLNRMARIWKVQETGSIGDVVVRIPIGALAGVNPVLIRSADATFANDDPRAPMVQSGATYRTTVDLTSGEYFTFAAEPVGPGGVTSDLQLWLRADEGLDVDASDNATLWIDRSVRGRSANLVFSDPQRIEDAANFNPVVRFDGDDSFRFSASPFVTGYTAGEVFATTKDNAASTFNNAHPFDFGSGSRHSHYTWGNGAIYDGFGTTDRLGWNPTDRSVADAKLGVSAITGPTFDTRDYHVYNPRSAAGNWGVRVDGTPTATSSTNTTSFALEAPNEEIGRTGSWTQSFVGDVGDVILYNRTLTPIEVARVNSYLAVKYGITLDQTSGGQNYVSSRDVAVWDKDFDPDGAGPLAASAFNQDIAGIERDVGSALTQPKSRSINPDATVTMSAADTPDDGDALLWGNNGGGAAAWGTTGVGSVPTHYRRIARTWSVQSTGDVGPVSVAVDVADPQLDLPAPVFDYFLLRDADGDGELADETPLRLYDDGTHGDETAGDNQFTVDGIVFAQGEEFTVATFMGYSISGRLLDAPGGAGINGKKISLLLDGGAKVTVTTATDAAGGGLPGEFLFTLVDMRTTRIVAVFVDDEVENGMTVTRDADDAISGLDIIVDTLVVRHEDAGPMTNDDLFSGGGFDGAPDADVTAVYTVTAASAGTLSTAAGVDLRVRAGASYAPGGDIDLERDLAIEPGATLTAGAAIALAGDWINEGTFTAGASTVTLDGEDQAIVGPTTFNHLVKREATDDGADSTLTIDAGGIGITGTLTLDGLDADDLLRIRSGNPGVAATIAFTGPAAAHAVGSFLDVEDSALANDAGAAVEFPVAPASSYDSGNTTNWFGDLLVEFTDTAASDAEASGGNLPTLTVSGHGTSDAKSIHVALAGGTAAQGADFAFPAPVEATIPAGDYTTPQVVPFAAPAIEDDGMLEEAETIVLALADPTSGAAPGDADGTDGAEDEHTYTIDDDETAAIEFDLPSSTTTDELVGPPVNARLRLTATTGVPEIGPGVTVQADVAYDAGASTAATGEDIEFEPVTVAFGEGSGDGTLAAVPYTLLDDAEIEGDENAVFRLFETGGGTVPASVGPIDAHTLTITDDDVPGVSIVQTDGSTTVTERGASDVLQVRLTARPTANVTVSFTVDLGEAAVGGPLVFTPADWDVFQTLPVTAVDDPVIEGDHIDRIDLSTASADPNFDGLARNDVVTVSVTDDDQAGAVVVVYDDVTSEDGDTGTFGIRLTARPSAPVTIALSSSNEGEATVPASITIQPDNWDDPSANIVTVTGVDDDPPVGDGAVPVTIVTGNVTSDDANFEALDGSEIDDVTVYNQNNDPPGIAVEVVDALSGEDGSTAVVRFRLLSRPALDASVTIPLSVSDSTEASAPASITIAADDWDNPAANEVLVTGLDDFLEDSDVLYRLVTGDPTSADPGYDALGADDVADPSLTNVDDDEPAVLVFEPGGATAVAEGDAPDTIEVQLATEPAPGRQVVLRVLPHPQLDLGSGPGQPVQLVFTNADWNEPHVVVVNAVDDARLEGDHSAPISYLVDADLTTEEGYDPVTLPPTTVSIGDNDTATVSLAPVLDALENPAENGLLRLTLSNQNDTGGPIEIAYAIAGTAVAGADYTALTGTVAVPNGQTEVTITVETAGHDDTLLEGPETVVVTLTASDHAAVTVDPGANEATVTIHDDETATATLSVEADGDETGPAHLVYRVELSSPNETGTPITFAIDPSGGMATADADYANFAGATVSVPAGSSVGTHIVTVLDDDLLEGAETVQATISAPSLAAVTIAGATATASIADDETALASVAPLQDGAENPAQEGLFQLSLSPRNDTGGPIAITYAVAGTAGAGSDYASLSGTAIIPNGQSAATIAVATAGFDDALLEGAESVIVTVTGTDRPTVTVDPAANEATVVIADDEIAFATLSVESDGAEAGPVDVVYRVDLSASNDTGAPITFAIDPSGGTATAGADYGDYAGATVTIPTGESSATFTVGVLDDGLLEGTESVEATISSPSFDGVTISEGGGATASIADDEAAMVALSASDPAAAENPADPGELTVELSRPNDTGSPLEVRYTVGGTGTGDADYDVLTGTVFIPDGETAGTIPVETTALDDALLEGSETVVVTLTEVGHGGVTVDPDANEATVTIADDETATAALSVESDGAEAGPVEIAYAVTLSRANSTGAPITFAIDPSGGTAAAAADYADFAGTTVTVPVGSSAGTHVVTVLDDALLEGTESVEATISSPSFGAVTISAASPTALIADDESATVGVSASDAAADENPPDAGELTIALSSRNDTGSSIEVAYSVAGTATAGSDYAPLSGTVSILDGETAVTVPVDTTGFDDARPEGSETVRLTLSTVSHPAVAIDPAASEATVTITDDDVPGVDVVETDGSSTVAEGGAGDELRVRLTAQPAADVVVSFAVDLGQVGSWETLQFTPGDWDVWQLLPLWAIDDPVIEGAHEDRVDLTTSSDDPLFDGLAGDDVAVVSVVDDDVAGAVVVVLDDVTSEDGETGSFGIRLTARPSAPVTIALSSSDPTEVSAPASITIQPDDWDDPSANVVTVTGVDDDPPVGDGAVPVTIVTGNVTSDDLDFEALDGSEIDDVVVRNQNNDPPGIAVEVVDGASGEDASPAVVRFRLLSQPAGGASVTVPVSVSDSTEGSLAAASVTIANDDWNDPAANELSITGMDDFLDDGDVPYQLVTGDPTSADPGYDALAAADAVDPGLVNVDDDEPAFELVESDGSTQVVEGGATDTISLVLGTQPAPGRQVVVRVIPHPELDLGAGPGEPVLLVFTDADWDDPHVLTVAAGDDARLEGDHSAHVSFLVDQAATTEDGYDTVTVDPTTVSIGDDEAATASVTFVRDGAENPAQTALMRVALTQQNDTGGPIEIHYTSTGTSTPDADHTPLSGTIAIPNGQTQATLTIDTTGHDDTLLEGPETVTATLTTSNHPAVTIDPAADEATVTIVDDETATATLSVAADGDEAGPTNVVYSVTLSRVNDTGSPITLAIDPSGGTSTKGNDYVDFGGATVTIPAGASSATSEVDVLNDDLLEGAQTVQATISEPSFPAVDVGTATATASIADDETATATVACDTTALTENPGSVAECTVTLSLPNGTGAPLTVSYSVGGSASSGTDYAPLSGTITIADGDSSGSLLIDTTGLDDDTAEGNETVVPALTGSSNPNVTVGSPDQVVLTIADDDHVVTSFRLSASGLLILGSGGDSVACRLAGASLRSCTVTVRTSSGRIVARGKVSSATGKNPLVVRARRTPFGKRLLARNLGGIRVVATANGVATTGDRVTARAVTRAILNPERFVTPPGTWVPDRAVLTTRGHRFVARLRGNIRSVRSMTCAGHTARVFGERERAILLSRARARVMCKKVRRLGARGPARLVVKGYSKPIATNATEAGRRQNRRVVVTLRH